MCVQLCMHYWASIGFNQIQDFGLPEEEKAHGRITMKTYFKYFKTGGSFLALAVLIVVFVFGAVSQCADIIL